MAEEPPPVPAKKPLDLATLRENLRLRRLAMAEKRAEVPPEKPVLPPTEAPPAEEVVERVDPPAPAPKPAPIGWRPRPVQLNAGRLEVSVPYHVGVVAALTVTLVVLAAFRIGQKFPGARARASVSATTATRIAPPNAVKTSPEAGTAPVEASAAPSGAGEPVQKEGDHWIVLLTQHKNEDDLTPVVEHYRTYGIELSIYEIGPTRQWFKDNGLNVAMLPSGDGYMLTTRQLYNTPDRPGTEGYDMKQKIRAVGATYKAPAGRETFAAKRFSDAYGMKITK
jgi:hypothetical protein